MTIKQLGRQIALAQVTLHEASCLGTLVFLSYINARATLQQQPEFKSECYLNQVSRQDHVTLLHSTDAFLLQIQHQILQEQSTAILCYLDRCLLQTPTARISSWNLLKNKLQLLVDQSISVFTSSSSYIGNQEHALEVMRQLEKHKDVLNPCVAHPKLSIASTLKILKDLQYNAPVVSTVTS